MKKCFCVRGNIFCDKFIGKKNVSSGGSFGTNSPENIFKEKIQTNSHKKNVSCGGEILEQILYKIPAK